MLRDELIKSGAAAEVAVANYPLTNDLGNNCCFTLQRTNEEFKITFNTILVSPEYGKATGWELIAGRDFSRNKGSESQNIIISESAVEMMGLENPIGEVLDIGRDFYNNQRTFTIIGVVRDMIKASPFERPKPLMVFAYEEALSFVFIRLNPSMDYLKSIPVIEETYANVLPGYPFNYEFVDDSYQLKFKAEERIGSLTTIFSVFAIIISCWVCLDSPLL